MNLARQELPGIDRCQPVSSPGGTIEGYLLNESIVPPGLNNLPSSSRQFLPG